MDIYGNTTAGVDIIVMLIFGLFSGVLYNVFDITIKLVSGLAMSFDGYNYKVARKKLSEYEKGKILHYVDFISTILIGIIYIVIQFILLDGVFRLFLFVTFVIAFAFARKKSEKILSGILRKSVGEFCALLIGVITFTKMTFCKLTAFVNKRQKRRNHKD